MTKAASEVKFGDHTYFIETHPPRHEGARMSMFVASALPGVLKSFLMVLIEKSQSGGFSAVGDLDISEVLKDVDADKLSASITQLIDRVLANEEMFFNLFRYTDLKGVGPLSEEDNFNRAFEGRYGDMYKLAWAIIRVNGFLPLGNLLKS